LSLSRGKTKTIPNSSKGERKEKGRGKKKKKRRKARPSLWEGGRRSQSPLRLSIQPFFGKKEISATKERE